VLNASNVSLKYTILVFYVSVNDCVVFILQEYTILHYACVWNNSWKISYPHLSPHFNHTYSVGQGKASRLLAV